jgi:hypothetical protein
MTILKEQLLTNMTAYDRLGKKKKDSKKNDN